MMKKLIGSKNLSKNHNPLGEGGYEKTANNKGIAISYGTKIA